MTNPLPETGKNQHGFLLVLVVGLGSILAWLAFAATHQADSYKVQQSAKRAATLTAQNAADSQKLSEYAWIDRSAGVIQIPIARAMDLMAHEHSGDVPHLAYPIATPTPHP